MCPSDGVQSTDTYVQLAAFFKYENKTTFIYFILYDICFGAVLCSEANEILADKQIFEVVVYWER